MELSSQNNSNNVSCESLGEEIVINGDFELGYFSFISDLIRANNDYLAYEGNCTFLGWFSVGNATVLDAPYNVGPFLPRTITDGNPFHISNTSVTTGNVPDHTNGRGNLLLIFPDDRINKSFWEQKVQVCENQEYFFSTWIRKAANNIPSPKISLSVDGKLLFPPVEAANANWQQLSTNFIADEDGVVTLSIIGKNGICERSTILIDDISFRTCGETFTISTNTDIICTDQEIFLEISENELDIENPVYQWQFSKDGGDIWFDIEGETTAGLITETPKNGYLYRLLTAEQGHIDFPFCRIPSNVIEISTLNCIEVCGNGRDDDRDGLIDEEDSDCNINIPSLTCDAPGITYYLPPVWKLKVGFPHKIFISTAFQEAIVNIRNADGTFDQDYVVQQGIPLELPLDENIMVTNDINAPQRDKGLIITSDVPITPVYQVQHENNQVILTIKGNTALGQTFRTASNVRTGGEGAVKERHFISMMASENNTTVTIDESPFKLAGIDLPYSVLLDRGETLIVHPEDPDHHVTGALVTSDKPIIVNSGGQHTKWFNDGDRDGGIDQLIPAHYTGKEYIVASGGFNDEDFDFVMIVGILDQTLIFLDGNPIPIDTVNAGEYAIVEMEGVKGTPHHIKLSHQAYAYHISGLHPMEFGMAILPPIDPYPCVGSRYIEFSPFQNFQNESYLVVPSIGLDKLLINGRGADQFGTALEVPGTDLFRILYIDQDKIDPDLNIIQSEEYLHVAQIVATNTGGTYGFYTNYQVQVNALDPTALLPTNYYIIDTVCIGERIRHTIIPESCSDLHEITNITGMDGNVSFEPSSLEFEYQATTPGLDILRVSFKNGIDIQGAVCIGVLVLDPKANAGIDQTICYGDTATLIGQGADNIIWELVDGQFLSAQSSIEVSPETSTDYILTVQHSLSCTDKDTVRVSINRISEARSLTPSICSNQATFQNATRFEGILNTSGNLSSFTYLTENGAIIDRPDSVEVVDNSVFNIVIFDEVLQCDDTTSITYSVKPFNALNDISESLCPENAHQINLPDYELFLTPANGSFTYFSEDFRHLSQIEDLSVEDNQVFQVIYEDSICVDTAEIRFSHLPTPEIDAGNDTTICPNTSIFLDASGGNFYVWEVTAGLEDTLISRPLVTPAEDIIYRVKGFDLRGCQGLDSVSIVVSELPTIDVGPDLEVCIGDSIQLNVEGALTYEWEPNITLSELSTPNPFAYPGGPTQYVVNGFNELDCVSTDTVNVLTLAPVNADAGKDTIICEGENVILSSSGGIEYAWEPKEYLSDPNASTTTFEAPPGDYNYVLSVMNELGCRDRDTVSIKVSGNPVIDIGNTNPEICIEDSSLLIGRGAVKYEWRPKFLVNDTASERQYVKPVVNTVFHLIGFNQYDCPAEDSTFIIVENEPEAEISPDTIICEGEKVFLSATGGFNYLWSTGETRDRIIVRPSADSSYWAIPFSQLGCIGDTLDTKVKVLPLPISEFEIDPETNFTPTRVVFTNNSIQASDYLWDFGDRSESTLFEPDHIYTSGGEFDIILISFNELGCSDTSFASLELEDPSLFAPNAFTPNGDTFNDRFRFPSYGIKTLEVKIFNRWGQLIVEGLGPEFSWDGKVDGIDAPEGVYVYKLEAMSISGINFTKAGTITLIR